MRTNKVIKTLLVISITVVFSQNHLFAQFWSTQSVAGTNCGVGPNFNSRFGTGPSSIAPWQDIRFYTLGVERMRLIGEPGANIGFLGLGLQSPQFKLHLFNDGGILAEGEFNSGVLIPAGLTSARMIWYPRKAAFRAGVATGGRWDDASIGNYSAAFGSNTTASGDFSLCFGAFNTASGKTSFAGGDGVKATGFASFAFGNGDSEASGSGSVVMGVSSFATGVRAFAIGHNLQSAANLSFTMGNGLSANNPIVNNIANSFMLGFNSDFPTLFVSGGNGTLGSFGRVGVGTKVPSNTLEKLSYI